MNENDAAYFKSYADLEVQEKMLNDFQRNEAYRNAIFSNQAYFKDKIVLDVGAGTGILSVFCAKAGASKVYAVEASNITKITKAIIDENEVQNIVQVIEGKIEDVYLPQKVDIIVSEWMGFYLFHEGMLDSVLVARDKFLQEDGVLFPHKCKLYVAPCTLPLYYSQWNDVNSIKMNTFSSELRKLYNAKPRIMNLDAENLLTTGNCVYEIWLKYVTIEELHKINCKLLTVSDCSGMYQGICIWFDIIFPSLSETDSREIILSTAPDRPKTHWKQTLLVMPSETEVEEGSPIFGNLTLSRSQANYRFYDIEYEALDPELEEHPVPCECYFAKCKIIRALTARYDERDHKMEDVD